MIYTQLDEQNRVIGVCELADEVDLPNYKQIETYDLSLLGKIWTKDGYVDPRNFIKVTLGGDKFAVDEVIEATIRVEDAKGNLVPLNSTYYVPVTRTSDKRQFAFLDLAFFDGLASSFFKLSEPGVYSVELDKVHPIPTAVLEQNILFVVI